MEESPLPKLAFSTPSNPNPNPKKRPFPFRFTYECEKDDEELLTLSLSTSRPSPPPPPPPLLGECFLLSYNPSPSPNPSLNRGRKARKNPFQEPKRGKSRSVEAPYAWATTRRARVHSLDHLRSQGISVISGQVECKGCQETYTVEYNLEEKFKEVKDYISANKLAMNDRAPYGWMNPRLQSCGKCGGNYSLKPVIAKKRKVNWLFLLLGQMLGCCKLSDLKYFCKHTKNHRTGAKDRVLYLTYLGICKQLDPHGSFDV